MVRTTAHRLQTAPDSELSLLLRTAVATGEPVLVDTGDATFVVGVALEDDGDAADTADPINRTPSPEQVARSIAGIEKAAGAWSDIDAEAFKAYIRERRRTAGRPPLAIVRLGEEEGIGQMVALSKTIEVEPGSELDQILEEVAGGRLRLVRNGVRYLLELENDDPWADYDPEKVLAGMLAAAGKWTGMDAETFKEYVYRGREEGTRPLDRP